MKPELKYGLIAGAGVCLWMTAEYLLGFHSTRPAVGEYTTYFARLIPLTMLYLLVRHKQSAGARLSPVEGLGAGLYASFVAAVVVYCFLFFYSRFVNAGWLDYTLEWKVAQWRDQGVSEVEIRRQIVFYRQANSPAGLLLTVVGAMTLVGGLVAGGLVFLTRQRTENPAKS